MNNTMGNTMKRTGLIFAGFCLVWAVACSSDPDYNSAVTYGNGSISIVKVTGKELLSPYGEQDPAARTAANGANDFAFRLGAELVKSNDGGSFVCSPFSVWMPLAALANATNAQNKTALFSALGAAGISEADINKAASRILYDLTKLRNKEYEGDGYKYYNPLKIANAIFVGNNVTLKKEFVQTFMDYYRGTSINVDFSSRNAVDAVNRWASDNTEGLITDLVKEFDERTIAAIANAIYFSDRWSWQFQTEQTEEGIFHGTAGDAKAFFMLREGNGQTYYEDSKVKATQLYFENGGSMYILLPKAGTAAAFLSSMTSAYFNEIQTNSISATGRLLLPRFTIEDEIDGLKEALEMLGVPLFDERSAPLTGGLIEEDLRVWVSQAMQKALIKVDEKGTTAAAVTVMGMAATGMPQPTTPFEMICDRPFVFILCERTSDGGNQILFTGLVNQM